MEPDPKEEELQCPDCDGSGTDPDGLPCEWCGGSGVDPWIVESVYDQDPGDEALQAATDPKGEPLDLGPGCICEGAVRVANIVMLERKAPVAGHGWGCVPCGLEPDGALAVVCAACWQLHQPDPSAALVFACRGHPATEGRVPIGQLSGEHCHDLVLVPEQAGASRLSPGPRRRREHAGRPRERCSADRPGKQQDNPR